MCFIIFICLLFSSMAVPTWLWVLVIVGMLGEGAYYEDNKR